MQFQDTIRELPESFSALRGTLPIRRDLLNYVILLWLAAGSLRVLFDVRLFGFVAGTLVCTCGVGMVAGVVAIGVAAGVTACAATTSRTVRRVASSSGCRRVRRVAAWSASGVAHPLCSASTGSPLAKRCKSSRIALAVLYRSATFGARSFATIA